MTNSFLTRFTRSIVFFSLFAMAPWAKASDSSTSTAKDFRPVVSQLESVLNKAVSIFEKGDAIAAQGLVSDAYFDLFESSGMELAVGARSDSLKTGLEAQFNGLRGAMAEPGQDAKALRAKEVKLVDQLKAVSLQMAEQDSPWQAGISSFTIILREGFEAILVIGAIVAFLIKTGNREHLRVVRSAVWTAIGASVLTAVLFRAVLHISSAQQELVEGLTMLLACAILFMIGHWLVGQAEAQHWNSFIRAHLKSSLSGGSRRTLWFTVFLAVFREGAEVVLFYQALWLGSGARESTQLIGGFLLGCLALGAIFVTFKFGVLRIPIRPFFRVTGALLFYLAFAFAGKSIVELQAGGYLLVNEMHGWPTINALGIYPTVQSLGLQAFMLMLLAASLIWTFAIRNRNSSPEQGV